MYEAQLKSAVAQFTYWQKINGDDWPRLEKLPIKMTIVLLPPPPRRRGNKTIVFFIFFLFLYVTDYPLW